MEKSGTTVELTKALVKVQSQLKGAKQDSVNPFFKSKYADLTSVWDACRALLAENELGIIQTTDVGDNHQLIIETILLHSSGEWIAGRLPMILAKNDPQGIGSAITYGRRYGLSAMVGICPEDDDAESAVERKRDVIKKPIPDKPEPSTKSSKPERDLDTIKTISELYRACNEDFKLQPKDVIAELGVKSHSDISDTPAECYRKIAAVR